jgi:tetratricopeptide (TPR) repeat protein
MQSRSFLHLIPKRPDMRCLLLFFTLFLTVRCSAQEDTLKAYLQAGISKHDAGDYDGAIRQYDRIIAIDPKYYLAYSEKTFSLFAAGKYPDCIDLCKQVLKDFSNNDLNGNIYTNYASALDAQGQSKEAIKVYTEGIRKFPHEHLLFFNRGITEYNQNDHDAAAKDLEESLRLSPGHAGSHQALAFCVYDNNRIAGALALATFLMVEPTGPRAEKNLATLTQLLHKNVSQKNDSNVTITLSADDLNTKQKGDDNFHQAELMLSLTAAMDAEEQSKGKTAAELLEKKLEILAEITPTKKGFFSNFYVPFFAGLQKASLLEAASHVMYLSAKNPSDQNWLRDNNDKVQQLQKYMNDWEGTAQ